MHEKALHRLEKSIGKAVFEVICETGIKRLPLPVSRDHAPNGKRCRRCVSGSRNKR